RVNEVFNESITSQQPYQVVYRLLMADGRIKWVDERGQTTYSTSGTPLISRGTVQDITQQKESEQEIIQANRAKDDFLASMSHELRTPLTSIIGNSELLAEAEVDLDKKKVIRAIEVAGRSQLALVNDVLDMSKIESGKFSIQEVPFDLATLIYDIEHMFELRARDAGLELAVELRSQEPYRLMGDGQRIGQVLINLIGNAIKFTNEGKVTLSIWSDQRYLNFVVEDTGVGISPEKMDSLFQRFEQADNSISRRFGGTGLGLFISETLSTLMGGIIDASSIEGKGSRFVLSLPYRQSTILVQLEQQIEQRNSVLSGGFEGRVLVAEDTPELQLLERRILESMGVKVEVANNGVEAVQMVTEHPFDLVLMDMQMPLMDGVEATRQIRAHNNQVPIVALTANVMEGHRVAFEEAGSNSFLSKPIDRQELRQVLAEFLPELDEILASDRRAAERRVVSRRVEERRSTL
ncbi:MAG TPA: response regulator, partial [Gammaproteobacteria bacterium]|nr:response regulator [Gammaproteobacteria bacterium]